MFDRDGSPAGNLDATDIAWIDSDNYLAFRTTDALTGRGSTWLGRVGQATTTSVPGSFSSVLASDHGLAALALYVADTMQARYAISASGQVGNPRPGIPLAWSSDGSLLAVLHVTQPQVSTGGHDSGWVQIVRGLDGAIVQSAPTARVTVVDRVAFSPDGRYLAFAGDAASVIDVATGHVSPLGTGSERSIAWLPDDTLLVDTSGSRLSRWQAGMALQQTEFEGGWYWSVSVQGTVVSSGQDLLSTELTLQGSTGAETTTQLPGSLAAAPVWADDGKAFVAVCKGSAVLIIMTS